MRCGFCRVSGRFSSAWESSPRIDCCHEPRSESVFFIFAPGRSVWPRPEGTRRFRRGQWAPRSASASSTPRRCCIGLWSGAMSNLRNKVEESSGRFAYEGLERVIHEKARLSIMTSLAAHPSGLVFTDLKEQCALTDGNLSRHLQVLHEAGLVE